MTRPLRKRGNDAKPLTHIDAQGRAKMVDVGHKPIVRREAIAEGFFVAAEGTIDRLMRGDLPKGEALAVARVAGVLAAKRVDEIIPLCHSLPLDAVNVAFERVSADRVRVTASATVTARTGVEMEALAGVTAACLTLYDMAKAIDKSLCIERVRLVSKVKSPPK